MNTLEIGDAELRVLKKLVAARGGFVRLTAKEQTALNSLERRLTIFDKLGPYINASKRAAKANVRNTPQDAPSIASRPVPR